MPEHATHALRSEHVSFQLADAQNLPFAEGSFDLGGGIERSLDVLNSLMRRSTCSGAFSQPGRLHT
jgi:hypothetical protein